jgi:hypothetical protein
MTTPNDIIIVSGLPRSGTSLMMQMLQRGGVEIITDELRTADSDNPRGYLEFEAVKNIQHDSSWLPTARGKAFKMISLLLYHLPPTERYRILFMERDLDEVLTSQQTMLQRMDRTTAPRAQMQESFGIHLEHLNDWMKDRVDMTVLRISYRNLIEQPEQQAQSIGKFLGRSLDLQAMPKAVDPALYRNRNPDSQLP